MKEFFWKMITKPLITNKHQRKNFYKSISKVGVYKYLQMKKMNLNEGQAKFKYNVSIVAIAKNEGIYFKEWIKLFCTFIKSREKKQLIRTYLYSQLLNYKY